MASSSTRSTRATPARKTSKSRGSANVTPWLWMAFALLVVLIDQFFKILITRSFQYGESRPVTRFFNLVLVYNKGAAFSFLADAGGWQRWFFTLLGVVVGGFIVWLLYRHTGQKLFCLAVSLILGGAIGNVVDRVLYGHVIDFLDFHWRNMHFPAFNVADCAITVGAVLLILDELRRVRRH
ncbi:Lipoprotein signal peptidase [compost metagenome]|jgi:signal peptidase II|uniref:Lipoprotein signal peptidase n=1 Tax=Cupriavidus campinensis TaxID=151783 RepID=A0AAE9I079_9BURK|nr:MULTISPECIES: signal peptidase II [Cupriavidus]TSP09758.1 lipoprotein signal peptidase [Cupriavidus campinensis]URF03577.1 signal peptidase II [Cupriavidus campinensis]CAG2149015.1 Lipoprotein signal peptidase [Cupriavidus campinensis]SFD34115.1 signal peptidase II Aspartic peptidase. MEROPS family A08 [Cupriavidus sp. OV038]SFQ05906.1 signal peptidase II . Aspartic peptidase. MEROPS family A08 [Cupriavidus sp. OV096]